MVSKLLVPPNPHRSVKTPFNMTYYYYDSPFGLRLWLSISSSLASSSLIFFFLPHLLGFYPVLLDFLICWWLYLFFTTLFFLFRPKMTQYHPNLYWFTDNNKQALIDPNNCLNFDFPSATELTEICTPIDNQTDKNQGRSCYQFMSFRDSPKFTDIDPYLIILILNNIA